MCKCTPNIRTPWCGKPGCETPKQTYRPTPKRLIMGPVKHMCQMIHDSEGNHVCDIRGYGRLSYMENSDQLQDKIGDWVAEAINEKLTKDPI